MNHTKMGKAGGKREGAGRKKGFVALEAERQRIMIAEKLVKDFAPIVEKAIQQAKDGDFKAREWLTDRSYGKATTPIEMTVTDLPVPIASLKRV